MYIEPCCADRQLPRLLRAGGRFFQTSGDVSARRLLTAASWLCGRKLALTLLMPSVDAPLLRTLAHYFSQGWLTRLSLLTQADQSALVTAHLPTVGAGQTISYGYDKMLSSGLMLIEGDERTLFIQGPLLCDGQPFAYRMYAAVLSPTPEELESVMETVRPKIRHLGH